MDATATQITIAGSSTQGSGGTSSTVTTQSETSSTVTNTTQSGTSSTTIQSSTTTTTNGTTSSTTTQTSSTTTQTSSTQGGGGTSTTSSTTQSSWKNIFYMVFNKASTSSVTSNAALSGLMSQCYSFSSYSAVSADSSVDYCAFLSGTTTFNPSDTTIVDLLEQQGMTWKSYSEQYQQGPDGGCNMAPTIGDYSAGCNPFLNFTSITSRPDRCQKIGNETHFENDLKNNQLPRYAFYVPGVSNSGANGIASVGTYLATWLQAWYFAYQESWKETMLVVTFATSDVPNNLQVPCFFLSPTLVAGTVGQTNTETLNHFSLVKFTEQSLFQSELNLGRSDATASQLTISGTEISGNSGTSNTVSSLTSSPTTPPISSPSSPIVVQTGGSSIIILPGNPGATADQGSSTVSATDATSNSNGNTVDSDNSDDTNNGFSSTFGTGGVHFDDSGSFRTAVTSPITWLAILGLALSL